MWHFFYYAACEIIFSDLKMQTLEYYVTLSFMVLYGNKAT